MERLTTRINGEVCLNRGREWGDTAKYELQKDARERLAAYEDTGLEPHEIMAIIFPPNPPLTLDELLEMDGEQVWIDNTEGNEDCNGWARVELTAPWKPPDGLKPHVIVIHPQSGRDYAGLLLECGVKIYRYKPEEESR